MLLQGKKSVLLLGLLAGLMCMKEAQGMQVSGKTINTTVKLLDGTLRMLQANKRIACLSYPSWKQLVDGFSQQTVLSADDYRAIEEQLRLVQTQLQPKIVEYDAACDEVVAKKFASSTWDTFQKYFKNDQSHVALVVQVGNETRGFIACSPILDIWRVHLVWFIQGSSDDNEYGRLLIKAAEDAVRLKGHNYILEVHTRDKELYEGLGYTIQKESKPGVYFMRKNLVP